MKVPYFLLTVSGSSMRTTLAVVCALSASLATAAIRHVRSNPGHFGIVAPVVNSCSTDAEVRLGAALVLAAPSCAWDSGLGATFNLAPFVSDEGIMLQDDRNIDDGQMHWEYAIGFCNNLDQIPSNYPMCQQTGPFGGPYTNSAPAPAYQFASPISKDDPTVRDKCYRLGGDVSVNGNQKFDLIWGPNSTDPSEGVSITYKGGDLCSTDGKPREITVHLLCDTKASFQPSKALVVEDSKCKYGVIVHSKYACPLECDPDYGEDSPARRALEAENNPYRARELQFNPKGGLCHNHGVCGYDQTNGYAKCFCNEGYSGPYCETLGDKGLIPIKRHTANVVGALFGGIVTGLVIAGGAYWYLVVGCGGMGGSMGGSGGGYAKGPSSSGGGDYAPEFSGAAGAGELDGADDGGYTAPIDDMDVGMDH